MAPIVAVKAATAKAAADVDASSRFTEKPETEVAQVVMRQKNLEAKEEELRAALSDAVIQSRGVYAA